MAIPNDPENRWWIEVSGSNPALVADLRPSVVAFVAFAPDREPKLVGTGFLIAAMQDLAVAITAKHVLYEGAFRTQKPMPRHAASSLFVRRSSITPSIEPKKLKMIWMGSEHAAAINAVYVGSNDTLDAACVICIPQDVDVGQFRPAVLPLDTSTPSVGQTVYLISHDKLETSNIFRSDDPNELREAFFVEKRISIRVGVVTRIYPHGLRHYRWPCFTTSIPAEPGMSGGLVSIPAPCGTIAACGLVCADNSSAEARADQLHCGESIISSVWPMLTLCIPESIPPSAETKPEPLIQFMRSGRMPIAVGGIDQIDFIDLGGGDYRIGIKAQ